MSSSKQAIDKNAELNEDELSELLDSALDDFCNSADKSDKTKSSESPQKSVPPNKPTTGSKLSANENPFNLNDDNAAFRLFESDPELKECFTNLMKTCNEEVGNDDNDFRESLHNTLRIISEKAKDIAGDENIVSEDDIANTLANLAELNSGGESGSAGVGGAQSDLKNIMPLMSNIMENLLSKDFLYPTLSDLSTKYPDYLKENKETLSAEDYSRYEKQYKLIMEICEEFESEGDNESAECKNARFNRILTLMQTMQSHGTPPPSLVTPSTISPDAMGDHLNMLNQFDDRNCSIM